MPQAQKLAEELLLVRAIAKLLMNVREGGLHLQKVAIK